MLAARTKKTPYPLTDEEREEKRRNDALEQRRAQISDIKKSIVVPGGFTLESIVALQNEKLLPRYRGTIRNHLAQMRSTKKPFLERLRHRKEALAELALFQERRAALLGAIRAEEALVDAYVRHMREAREACVVADMSARVELLDAWEAKDARYVTRMRKQVARLEGSATNATASLFSVLRGHAWPPPPTLTQVLRLTPMRHPVTEFVESRWARLERMNVAQFSADEEFTTMWGDKPELADVLIVGLTNSYVVFARPQPGGVSPLTQREEAEEQDEFDFQWPHFLELQGVLWFDESVADANREKGVEKPYAYESDELFVVPVQGVYNRDTKEKKFVARKWGSRDSDRELSRTVASFLRQLAEREDYIVKGELIDDAGEKMTEEERSEESFEESDTFIEEEEEEPEMQ